MSTKKEWTPKEIRAKVLDLLAESGRAMSHCEIGNKMSTCPKQKVKTQLDYLIFNGKVTKSRNDHSHKTAVRYEANSNASLSKKLRNMWPSSLGVSMLEPRVHRGQELCL